LRNFWRVSALALFLTSASRTRPRRARPWPDLFAQALAGHCDRDSTRSRAICSTSRPT
jgi:hypothetical protein